MIEEKRLREALAANIVRLRRERGWSQEDLARTAGISRVHVNRIERQHNLPGADLLYSIADALGVSTDTLRLLCGPAVQKSA